MLVLTRKIGEPIAIGDQIKVVVVSVKSGQVRIGIEAPQGIQIYREEIYQRIQEENRRAAQSQPDVLTSVLDLFKKKNKD